MDFVRLGALLVNGFTACAEFASFAFVHPSSGGSPLSST